MPWARQPPDTTASKTWCIRHVLCVAHTLCCSSPYPCTHPVVALDFKLQDGQVLLLQPAHQLNLAGKARLAVSYHERHMHELCLDWHWIGLGFSS